MHRSIRPASQCLAGVLVLTGALAAQQPARDTAIKPLTGTAIIMGTVVADEPNGRPIRRVTVTLTPASSGMSIQRMTSTDDAGRFVFTALPAGNYSAPRASKAGYVPATYGEKRTGGIGTPITLTEGQRLTVAVKMLRGAVITGTLLDQNRPAAQTAVRATPIRIVNGERQQTGSGGSATTDDRGTYRIYGLAPGDYLVSASPRFSSSGELRQITPEEIRWAQQQLQPAGVQAAGATLPSGVSAPPPQPAQALAYTPVYYPGTTVGAQAVIVAVTAGQERSGVNFSVQFVPTAKLEGTIVGPDGQAPQNAQLTLISRADTTMLDPIFMLESMMLTRPTVTNGKFSLAGVRPGDYTLAVRAAAQAGGAAPKPLAGSGRSGAPPPMTLWASADITVDGTDQSGIQLRLERGMELSGRVAFEGTTLQPPADLSRVSIRLSTAPSPGGMTVSVNVPSAQVAPDGTFMLEGVTPGRYFLSASAPSETPAPGGGWIVKSARVGDVDAADVPFEVRPAQSISDVVVTFTDKTAELSGTLFDAAGHPTPEFSIVLFSTDKAMWSQRSRRLRAPIRVSTDGKFRFANLLAGEYYLAALTDFEPGDYYKPEFLEQVAAAATKVTLADGEKKVQDLRIAGLPPAEPRRPD